MKEPANPDAQKAGTPASSEPNDRPARRAMRQLAKYSGAFAAGLAFGLATSFVVDRATSRGQVLRGIEFRGVRLSGLNAHAVADATKDARTRFAHREVMMTIGGRTFSARLGDLGITLTPEAIRREALAAGRSASWPRQLAWWGGRLLSSIELEVPARIDTGILLGRVAVWKDRAVAERPVEGAIVVEQGEVRPRYPRPGLEVDAQALVKQLRSLVASPRPWKPVDVPLVRSAPRIDQAEVDRAVESARRLLNADVVLRTPGDPPQWRATLGRAALAACLTSRITGSNPYHLETYCSAEGLEPSLRTARAKLERASRPATFEVDRHHRVKILPSERGVRIDAQKTAAAVLEAARSPTRVALISLTEDAPPALTTEQAHELNVRGLVAKFTTFYACCEPRVKNIRRAAELVDGTVLLPGQVFSLNDHLGPRTAADGFVMAPTIVNGEMEETTGGGISQFATTLFNAVLDGGYEILQRQPHSYYFSRYPEGHEATVSYPVPDLRFKNDTKSGLLLKTQVADTFVRILLYGDNEGRRVERGASKRFDIVDPPIEYEVDATMPADSAELLYAGRIGWSIEVSRKIQHPDGGTTEQRRKVVYNPRPRRVRVHPCKVPEGEKGHTGEECPSPPDAGTSDASASIAWH